MDQVSLFLEKVGEILGPQILFILALIVAQFILGVAVAIKDKVFDWTKLGDFYRTQIVPKLLAWLACAIIAKFVIQMSLPDEYSWVGPGITYTAFTVVVLSLLGNILTNLKALGILGDTLNRALTSVGIHDKVATPPV